MSAGYRAFISYSHAADGRLAPALHGALQQFGKPWYRLRALRIFRDETNLSVNPALWSSIVQALEASEYFIFLASPDAARSEWVDKEVRYWKQHKPDHSILLVLTEGTLAWDEQAGRFDPARSDALPEQLLAVFAEEPRFLDLRWARQQEHLSISHPRFRDAVAELASTLQGRPKDELIGEEIRQHRKAVRLAWSAAGALVLLTVSALIAAWVALTQQRIAEVQTRVAVEQRQAAEQQSRIALAGQLAAQANLLRRERAQNLPLSVLLAIESLRLHESADAERALRAGLRLLPRRVAAFEHGERVTQVVFSPDGQYLATASDDGTAGVHAFHQATTLSALAHEEAPGQVEHSPLGGFSWKAPGWQAEVRGLAFSPDGRRLATGNNDGKARVWDVGKADPSVVLAHDDGVVTLAFHPQRKLLATGSKDGTARLWSLDTGIEELRVSHRDEVREVAFTRDGRYLAAINTGGGIDLWDLTHDASHSSWHAGGIAGLGLAFSHDGTRLATIADNTVTIWDTETHEPQIRVQHRDDVGDAKMSHWSWIDDVAFSPDDAYLATAGRDGTARVWDATTGEEVVRLTHESGVNELSFGLDGQTLLCASNDGTARLWEVPSGKERLRFVHQGTVHAVAFSPDGNTLVSADSAGNVSLWSQEPGDELVRMPHADDVVTVAYSPDGSTIATAEDGGKVRFWTHQGRATSPPLKPPVWRTDRLFFSNDGRRLGGLRSRASYLIDTHTGDDAVAVTSWRDATDLAISPRFLAGRTRSGAIDVYSAHDGQKVISLTGASRAFGVRLSRNGDFLVARYEDDVVRVLALPQGEELMRVVVTNPREETMAISPQGHLLAIASKRDISIWDTSARSQLATVSEDEPIRGIWFSPKGNRLIVLTYRDVYIRALPSAEPIARLQHQGEIRSFKLGLWRGVSMSDDNNFIATLSNGRVRIWDLSSGQELASIGEGQVIAMTFSPDGRWLVTGNRDASATVWKWKLSDLIDTACERVTRNLSQTEWKRFLGRMPWRPSCGQATGDTPQPRGEEGAAVKS